MGSVRCWMSSIVAFTFSDLTALSSASKKVVSARSHASEERARLFPERRRVYEYGYVLRNIDVHEVEPALCHA